MRLCLFRFANHIFLFNSGCKPEREVNLRRARDLLRSIRAPDNADSKQKNHPADEEDSMSRSSERGALQGGNIVKLIGWGEATEELPTEHSSAFDDKDDSEHEAGYDDNNEDSNHYGQQSSHNFDDSTSSSYSKSTTEIKALCITVVSRSSRYVSFPSSRAHTYATSFRATMSMSQIVAVLDEQLRVTREGLVSFKGQISVNSKTRNYQGEYNQEGEKHGYGLYASKNGNEYLGEWQHNKREGLGIVKVGNGDIFEGQFETNLKCGIGVYHYKGKRAGFDAWSFLDVMKSVYDLLLNIFLAVFLSFHEDGECDLSMYEGDARVGDSVRFSADRTQAFLITCDSSKSNAISLKKAAKFAKGMGTTVTF